MGKTRLGEITSNIFFSPGTRKKYMSSIQPESRLFHYFLTLGEILCGGKYFSCGGESFLLLRSIIAFGIKYLQEICLQD